MRHETLATSISNSGRRMHGSELGACDAEASAHLVRLGHLERRLDYLRTDRPAGRVVQLGQRHNKFCAELSEHHRQEGIADVRLKRWRIPC